MKQIISILLLLMLIIPASASINTTSTLGNVISLNEAKVNESDEVNASFGSTEETNTLSEQSSKDYSSQDVGASMIQKGIDACVLSLANAVGSVWKNNSVSEALEGNSNVTDEYGATRGAIFTFITENPEPDKIEPIANFESNTKAEWAFLVCVFILGFLMVANIARANKGAFNHALGDHDLSDSRFIGGAFLCMASYFAPKLVLLSIDLCEMLSKFAMLNVLDYIEPSIENAWMYLFMTIGEALVSIFFIIRPWVIDIFYASSRFLAVLFFMGLFVDEIRWVVSKYIRVLLLQPVCIFVACICLIALKWAHMEDAAGAYIILFLFVAYINYKWMFGNFGMSTIKRVALSTVKKW
ncbi:MAG: hypothetical protein PHQ11_15895 [Paludibacter sp.]|nr:hypothetical protein [Paludibacter sp.]